MAIVKSMVLIHYLYTIYTSSIHHLYICHVLVTSWNNYTH